MPASSGPGGTGSRVAAIGRRLRRADRVLSRADVTALAGPGTPDAGIVPALLAAGCLADAGHDLFLNRRVRDVVMAAEAASRIAPGAVVSLQTVLGDSGVLNNHTRQVISVVPDLPPPSGDVHPFSFVAMPGRDLHAPDAADLFDPSRPYARATPEAALVHWVYLSVPRDGMVAMPPPPLHDVDFDGVDGDRMRRVADAMGVRRAFDAWYARRPYGAHGDDQFSPGLGW